MTTMVGHLSNEELEARYEAAADPVAKSHFHALWLLSCGYEVEEVGATCRSRRAGFGRCSNATTRAVPRRSATNVSTTEPSRPS